MQVWSLSLEDPLEEEMATLRSILTWKNPVLISKVNIWIGLSYLASWPTLCQPDILTEQLLGGPARLRDVPVTLAFWETQKVVNFQEEEVHCDQGLCMNRAFLVAQMVKNSPASVGDSGSIPRLGSFPGEGEGYILQYSCLENHMDRGAWWATVHGIPKSQTQLSGYHFHFQGISRH